MLNSLLSISTRSILCPLHIHVLTVTTTVRTCRFSHFLSTAFAIGNITHPFHERDQPLDPQSLLYSIRGHATSELRVFFLQKSRLPPTSDLCTCLTTSVSPRDEGEKKEKNEKHKKSQNLFSISIVWRSLYGSEWPIYLPYLFIYLFVY